MKFRGSGLALALCVCLRSASAEAYEGQSHVALEGAAQLDSPIHAQTGAHYMRDLTDTWRVSGGLSHSTESFPRTGVRVGAAYMLDVLRYVPWVGVSAGADLVGGHGQTQAVVGLAGGLDVSWSRDWATGVFYRQEWNLTEISGTTSREAIGLRAMLTWGH